MNIFKNKQSKTDLVSKCIKFSVIAGVFGTVLFANSKIAYGHGYVSSPPSRARIGQTYEHGAMNWLTALAKYGSAVNEPQSIEGPGTGSSVGAFPGGGPIDGQIPSGGLSGFAPLNIQTENHWIQNSLNPGVNEFTWRLTAGHASRDFQYYITKQDWNPNTPLTRADLEHIETIPYFGSNPGSINVTHEVDIPDDRSGYHIILAVWDIADTAHAFYQVIDVNITNDPIDPNPNPDPNPDLNPNPNPGPNPHPNPNPNPGPNPDPNPDPTVPSFNSTTVYFGGEIVFFQGNLYRAKWWTQGGNPTTSSAWEIIENVYEDGSVDFRSATAYVAGDLVRYEGRLYRAKWWTQGGSPATSTAWEIVENVYEDGSVDFRLTTAYVAGDLVRYEGRLYRAKWWTQGALPTGGQAWEFIGYVHC